MAYHKVNLYIFLIYIFAMTGFMIWQGIGITPDRYGLLLFAGILFIHRSRKFILDWLPFLFLLISYDFLRGFADKLNPRVHFVEMIQIDKFIFGQLPTIILQNNFFQQTQIQWYDYLATFFYFLHFALPLAFALLLWLKNRNYFKRFTFCLLLLSYMAFFTYVVFPAAPPWLASQKGVYPGIIKILDFTLKAFPQRLNLPSIYNTFDPNTVAAIPSLHAAYPLLVLLYSLKFFGRKALWFIPYVLGVWISIVYLGEHYVTDIIVGAIYTLVSFYIFEMIYHLYRYKTLPFFGNFIQA